MASLVEELVTVLEEEEKIYQTLISYGEKKTDILIRADVPELEKLTCLEQLASDDLVTHSNQQVQLLKDIANVLGRTEEKMTVTRRLPRYLNLNIPSGLKAGSGRTPGCIQPEQPMWRS